MSPTTTTTRGVAALGLAALVVLGTSPQAAADTHDQGFPGTVKVSAVGSPADPDNEAKPGCVARVDYFNFNPGTYQVTFTAVPPSGDRELLSTDVTIEQESQPASDAQRTERYELDVSGLAADGVGYHVSLEVSDPDREGEGAKGKVFGFECAVSAQSIAAPDGGFRTGGGGTAAALPLAPLAGLAGGALLLAAGAVARRRSA